MTLLYEVAGYNRNTGRLEAFYQVPSRKTDSVTSITGMTILRSYPLDPTQVAEIARVLEMPIERSDELDFYLEPFDVPTKVAS